MSRKDWSFWVFILLLCFLFSGEPDVWDALRGQIIGSLTKGQP